MRINVHSHIFNLRSIFTEETRDIFIRRITDYDIPGPVKKRLTTLIEKALDKGDDYTEVDSLVEKFIKEDVFAKWMEGISKDWNVKLNIQNDSMLERAGAEFLIHLLGKLEAKAAADDDDAAKQMTVIDILNYIRIGLKPSIGAVASHLMRQHGTDDVVVALMMDITSGDGKDNELFNRQIADTSDVVLRFPGRVLPFFAVNPLRSDHRVLMERALTSQGFVGVKLYPSLGYQISHPAMDAVFRYCHERSIPILVHCSQGGFYAKEEYIPYGDPMEWDPVLDKYKGLRVCFGHFGGDDSLTSMIALKSWTNKIITLMKKPDNTGVYADIAYHNAPMKGGAAEAAYFTNLKTLMKDPVVGKRLLFGTDFWMVCTCLEESSYWSYFDHKCVPASVMRQLSEDNPMNYLGMALKTKDCSEPIRNYIRFIADHLDTVHGENSASWLVTAIKETTGKQLLKAAPRGLWTANNEAHGRTFMWLRDNQMMKKDSQKAKFDAAGTFSVTRLQYWNREFESAAIFNAKCMDVAMRLDRYFLANKARYEAKMNYGIAMKALSGKLSDESTTFSDLAKAVDDHYHFEMEG